MELPGWICSHLLSGITAICVCVCMCICVCVCGGISEVVGAVEKLWSRQGEWGCKKPLQLSFPRPPQFFQVFIYGSIYFPFFSGALENVAKVISSRVCQGS